MLVQVELSKNVLGNLALKVNCFNSDLNLLAITVYTEV